VPQIATKSLSGGMADTGFNRHPKYVHLDTFAAGDSGALLHEFERAMH
jgi:hypothetical protein